MERDDSTVRHQCLAAGKVGFAFSISLQHGKPTSTTSFLAHAIVPPLFRFAFSPVTDVHNCSFWGLPASHHTLTAHRTPWVLAKPVSHRRVGARHSSSIRQ